MFDWKCFFIVILSLSWSQAQIINIKNSQCQEKCNETYSKESNIESCNRGCRLAAITDALTYTQNDDLNHTIDSCDSACKSSYEATSEDIESCQRGCSYMVPTLQRRRQSLKSPLDEFFGNGVFHTFRVPRIFISGSPVVMRISHSNDDNEDESKPEEVNPFLRTENNQEKDVEEFNPFRNIFGNSENIFSNINKMMRNTLQSFHDRLPEMIKGGTGKMVIIKNGPNGFHETKTYNLGPDGTKWEEEKEEDSTQISNVNDMMNKENPLEKFMNNEDSEIITNDVLIDSKDMDEGFEVEYPKFYDEPKLPKSGLKTRHLYDDVCAEDSSEMNWSDWVSCIHVRIGMSRWLTAASISLGIVFALWLCLAIPQNAPKQRIILKSSLTKAAIAKAKEAEANGTTISVVTVKTVDEKPPAYEDIGTNLKVNLAPVHSTEVEKKAPLPEDDPKESKA